MPSHDRRAAARRRAWGRGPTILRLEPLEGRQLLSTGAVGRLPDLISTSFAVSPNKIDWGDSFDAIGTIANQGGADVMVPFQVAVYASPGPFITRSSVYLGTIQVPAGLGSLGAYQYDQKFNLPVSPLPGTDTTQAVYIDLRVDPSNQVRERNKFNNQRQGLGNDSAIIAIAAQQPANLVGTALQVTPNSVSWGNTLTLNEQVMNNGPTDAPATRARVVLTPTGMTPGGSADVTIGSIAMPPLAAWQTTNIVHQIALPTVPPSLLAASTQFTLSVVQDADFLTNQVLSNVVAQGLNQDQAQITIASSTATVDPNTPKPDLTATGVQVPSQATWGQSFPLSTTVQNIGPADAGPFLVRYVLTGLNGTVDNGLVLGETPLTSLKAGTSQAITQDVKIPLRVPSTWNLTGAGTARVLVQVDPENTVDESFKNNNVVSSAPIVLRLLGTDGTSQVPTQGRTVASTVLGTTQTVHPGSPTVAGTLGTTTKKTNEFKKIGNKVTSFFKDLGKKLNVYGSSHNG